MEVFLQTAHIRPVQVVGREMNVLQSWVVSLSVSDISILKDSLSFSNSLKQLIAFLIE